jgi:hypothetical protein
MKNMIAPCGTNCSRCPSYVENLLTDEDRQRCSDGWYRYHGFRLGPDKLRRCVGCQAPDYEDSEHYLINCSKRRCAFFNGIETCAHCSAYPCEVFGQGPDFSRERVEARLGTPVPEEDYLAFVEPYEGVKHLDGIRASLGSEDVVEMTPVSLEPELADFPGDLSFAEGEKAAYEALYQLLGVIGTASGISYGWREVLKKRRRHLLKMLWAFGCFGEPEEGGGPHLVLDSEAYLAQKIHSNYPVVKDYFKALGEYGVRCEHIPVEEGGWLTPTGALRKGGWYMRMSLDEDAGGVAVLEALRTYTSRLDEVYGKNAFRRFSRADMQVLGDRENREMGK